MILQQKTIEKLRELINEATTYRSGPQLVQFFSDLGFKDSYGQGFPSRWQYTEERLKKINGTPEIDKCIRKVFAPVNFVGDFPKLNQLVSEFNQYLAFDKWQVVLNGTEVTFRKASEIKLDNLGGSSNNGDGIDDFLSKEFDEVSIESISIDSIVANVLEERLIEIKKCLRIEAPLSVLFLCGSTLEGVLLGVANNHPKLFNQSNSSPRDDAGKVKQFHYWTLSDLINVAFEVGFINLDVKKFSHSLRDFRNYIHPFEQVGSGFSPDIKTSRISWQVLQAALHQIGLKVQLISTTS